MEIKRYEFLLEAEQPIAHHAESFGNEAIAMRRRVRQPDGTFADVPIITGDTMRHGLREAAALAYLDAAGLLEAGALTEGAMRLLFSGGNMSGRGDGAAVSIDGYRQLCDLVPMVAIFGGCAGNRCIPGRLTVEDATVVCEETARYVPAWALAEAGPLGTHRAHVEEVQRVRMDPALNPERRALLASGDAAAVNARLLAGEAAKQAGDAVGAEDAKSTMMPRRFERIVQGSLFFWRVEVRCMNDLDADTFLTALAAFLYDPVIGGKKGTGHGRLRALAARNVDVRRMADRMETVDTQAMGRRAGETFRAHVAARKAEIASFLRSVDA